MDAEQCEIRIQLVGHDDRWRAETDVGDSHDGFSGASALEAVTKATQWARFMVDWWASGERPSRSLSDY
jgi:hypothetical protein